ncbi:MAG: hypothetical protein J6T10_23985 [Methanobrevibacter sp.]|nr:hypothetical protein [Methanobrevibacter sp.]
MFMISAKFSDGSSIFEDNVTFIDFTDLPCVHYELDGIPQIESFDITDSCVAFNFSYVKTRDVVNFISDRDGGCDLSEFWRELPDSGFYDGE